MTPVLATASSETALAFIELGVVAVGLSLSGPWRRSLGIPAIPLYLLAGLLVGNGGFVGLDVSESFISRAADVLLLLLTLGLEYTADELKSPCSTSTVRIHRRAPTGS